MKLTQFFEAYQAGCEKHPVVFDEGEFCGAIRTRDRVGTSAHPMCPLELAHYERYREVISWTNVDVESNLVKYNIYDVSAWREGADYTSLIIAGADIGFTKLLVKNPSDTRWSSIPENVPLDRINRDQATSIRRNVWLAILFKLGGLDYKGFTPDYL